MPVNEVWLVDYGFTNNFEDVLGVDLDGDGYVVWEEYIMDTNPTNANSFLRFGGIRPVEGTNFTDHVFTDPDNPFITITQRVYEVIGEAISWSASTQRVYSIDSTTSLTSSAWTPGPAIRPVSSDVTITNLFDGSRFMFRRLNASLPED